MNFQSKKLCIKNHFLFLLFSVFTSLNCYSTIPVTITNNDVNELHFWKGKNIEILEDIDNSYTIDDILKGKYDQKFFYAKTDVPITKKNNTSYWARIKVNKQSTDNFNWVFEAYDQSIDEIYFYAPDKSGNYILSEGGDNKPFSIRQFQHKNFVFNLNLESNKEQIIYIKIKSAHPTSFIGVIRNVHSFVGYALKEYFYLALFYGLVISMIIFNLMQFFVTKLKIYIVYVAYIISAAIYASTQDGLGFQFVWTSFPEINNLFQYVSSFFVISLFLVLSYEFLKDTTPEKKYIQIGFILIGVRFAFFILAINGITLLPIFFLDLLIRLLIITFSISLLYKGHKQLRYFTIAITMLVLGYTIRELTVNGLFPNTIATVYMNLVGEAFQILFLSLALGEQLKIKMEALMVSQEKSLVELEQTHLKTEKLRKNLQQRVEEQIAREKYVSGGISDLSTIISNYLNDTDQLYKKISKFIAEYFECNLVALYMIKPGTNHLELYAGYGLDEIRLNGLKIEEGEGLLGQCLKDKERIEIHQVPENYISISSGLGQATPNLILIEPLHFNQQLVGVIEMASFKEFTALQYEVLDKFTTQIASSLSNVLFNDSTRRLLDESINKEEMLRQQEEEMRQQVEELMATQEEFTRKETEYLAEIKSLKQK